MWRFGSYILLSLGLALLAGTETLFGDASPSGPAQPSGLSPYLYQENMNIDGPSDYWLIAVPRSQPVSKALWCSMAEPSDEIVRVDGRYIHSMTREEVAAYFTGTHGWPVHLIVKPHSGGDRAVDCFDHP